MRALRKYPRTPHLEGSRLQPGDADLDQVGFGELAGHHLVVEEKVDGSNAAISFDPDGGLLLQSRGHYLRGGPRERHFAPLKAFAAQHRESLWAALDSRFVCFGEWLFATHTIFYDSLPAYFLEFDVWDRDREVFLDTPSRLELLAGTPLCHVPVLAAARFGDPSAILALVGPSLFCTGERAERFADACSAAGLREQVRTADLSGAAEGVYVKTEADGVVTGRYKWIRPTFADAVAAAGDHWLDLPLVANQLSSPGPP